MSTSAPENLGFIGNDIVDLLYPGNPNKYIDTRFVNRVFTPMEQTFISGSLEKDRSLWSLWAAKESAYKCLVKIDPKIIFAHKRFEVTPDDSSCLNGTVNFPGYCLRVEWIHNSQYVHAAVCLGLEKIRSDIAIDILEGPESTSVRHLATGLLSSLGLEGCQISGRPPKAYQNSLQVPGDLSLSHDGRFGSAVWLGWTH